MDKKSIVEEFCRSAMVGVLVASSVAAGEYIGNSPEKLQDTYSSLSKDDVQVLRKNASSDVGLSAGIFSAIFSFGAGRRRRKAPGRTP